MYNLWSLLVRHHLILTFLVCQAFALAWFFSSHGYPRGQWVRASLEVNSTWNEYVSDMSQLSGLAYQNEQLLLENAQLRSELLKRSEFDNPLSRESQRGRDLVPAEVIRSASHLSSNYLIINKGQADGVQVGHGALHAGYVVGKVVETTPNNALLLPLIHTGMEWSARLGKSGPVGRLLWNGSNLHKAYLEDIPRSLNVAPGDTVFTSGFQGVFPPEFLFGFVTAAPPELDGEFQRVQIEIGAPFQSLRYIHIVDHTSSAAIEDLIQSVP